jgi:hypothetical protein
LRQDLAFIERNFHPLLCSPCESGWSHRSHDLNTGVLRVRRGGWKFRTFWVFRSEIWKV